MRPFGRNPKNKSVPVSSRSRADNIIIMWSYLCDVGEALQNCECGVNCVMWGRLFKIAIGGLGRLVSKVFPTRHGPLVSKVRLVSKVFPTRHGPLVSKVFLTWGGRADGVNCVMWWRLSKTAIGGLGQLVSKVFLTRHGSLVSKVFLTLRWSGAGPERTI